MTIKKLLLPSILSLALSACLVAPKIGGPDISQQALDQEKAFQHQLILEQQIDTHNRVQKIGYNILRAGVDFCEKHNDGFGLLLISQQQIEKKHWKAANNLFGLTDRPKISAVFPNSPAERAGLQPLDTIVQIGGRAINRGGAGQRAVVQYLRKKQTNYQIGILRNGETILTTLTPETLCDYPIALQQNDAVNAYADGEKIVIFTGMADFAREDKELALVIAHELAHNTEKHVHAKKTNALGGMLLGAIFDVALGTGNTFSQTGGQIGASSYSVDFEREADYVGMYIMARSGYSLEGVGKFWRRMAVKSQGKSIDFASSHPTSAQRMLAIEFASKEINAKRQNNQPLIPNRK